MSVLSQPFLFSIAVCLTSAAPFIAPAQAEGFLRNGVTAHRGNSAELPENTLPAFRSAMELGADWIELDVYRTTDGKLVVSHDKKTGRVGDNDLVVSESTYEQLQDVDVATLFRKQRGKTVEECPPQRMPLLDDVLKLVMAQRKTRASIQPKMDCVADIVALVKKLGAQKWVGFNDGKLAYMAEVKRLAPEVPVFWDRGPLDGVNDIATARQHGFEAMVLHYSTITPDRIAAIKQAGMEVGVWTVNDRETMRRLLALGVERIYTDFPATLLELKANCGARKHQPQTEWVATGLLPAPEGNQAAAADERHAKPRKTVRLLTIGNSFSRNATRWLGDLVEAAGHRLIHHEAVIGGGSVAQHWDRVLLYEKDPHDKRAKYKDRSLKEELLAEKWDFATIQQYSFISHDPTTYSPYARYLRDFVNKHAPQAEVLVHQTWAYRCDDPRFTKPPTKPGEPTSQKAMYAGLTKAYEATAAELGLRIIPVGDAFYTADTDSKWAYKPDRTFDPTKAAFPALPNQRHSLHVGWMWSKKDPAKPQLRMDGHHANLAGEYLGACVFYEMLFGESVVDVAYVPDNLDAEYGRFLREMAHRAVQKRHPAMFPASSAPQAGK